MSDWVRVDLHDPAEVDQLIEESMEHCRADFVEWAIETFEPEGASQADIERLWRRIEPDLRQRSRAELEKARRASLH